MQIHAKRGRKRPQSARTRRQNRRNIRMVLEDRRESIFHDNGNPQIGARLLQQMNSGRRKYAIAQRTQPDHRDMAARVEPVESVGLPGHPTYPAYSSMVASSISMTGISSRIG